LTSSGSAIIMSESTTEACYLSDSLVALSTLSAPYGTFSTSDSPPTLVFSLARLAPSRYTSSPTITADHLCF